MARRKFDGTPFKPFVRDPRNYFRRKKGLPCDGCNKTCIFGIDYYMVRDSVWAGEAALPYEKCLMCIACLQTRIGRRLHKADFGDAPVNGLIHAYLRNDRDTLDGFEAVAMDAYAHTEQQASNETVRICQ